MEFSLKELEAEVQEKSLDLKAFLEAREVVRRRVLEVADSESRLTPLTQWSGTDAVLGTLDLVCHAVERTVEDLKYQLKLAQEEEATKRPNLRVVTGEET